MTQEAMAAPERAANGRRQCRRPFEVRCVLADGRQRNANTADVLETSLALTSAVLDPERLAALYEVVADVPVVLGRGQFSDIAVISNGRRGVLHPSSSRLFPTAGD